jgi:glycosyltransferase involved in cell wall biosynthesis
MNNQQPPPVLSIVCPMCDEEESIEAFFGKLLPVLTSLDEDFEIICVNDGSKDATLERLLAARRQEPRIRILDLSRNFGKEAALTCGLDHARGQAMIPIDADLQDPPELIEEMLKIWRQGFEVVLAQRTDRSTDSYLKRKTAKWFYRCRRFQAHRQESGGFFEGASRAMQVHEGAFWLGGFSPGCYTLYPRISENREKQVLQLETMEFRP